MEFLTNSNNLSEYVLKLLDAYYTESMLTWGIERVRHVDIIIVHVLKSVIFFGLSLACLVSRAKRKHFRIKRHRTKAEKVDLSRSIKKMKITEESKEEEDKSSTDMGERCEKIFLILFLGALAIIDVCNKLILWRILEYVTYPVVSITKSFRLFPTPIGTIGQDLSNQYTISILATTMGIFTYIFSSEERIENIDFLKRASVSHNFRILHPDDKIKIVRLGLRFLHACSKNTLEQSDASESEATFMQSILDNKLPDQDYTLPVQQQATKYYKNLLLLHRNKPVPPNCSKVSEVFENLLVTKKTGNHEVEKLAFSFINMIITGSNSRYFQIFLEKRRLDAAIYLTMYSWSGIILEAGQVLLCKRFRIQPELIITAVNLLTATGLLGFLLYKPHEINHAFKNHKKDVIISTLTSSYLKLFSRRGSAGKIDDKRLGLQIGMKFFSLFISIIMYGHDFNMGHILGIFLMIPGCLINLKIQNTLLSRWTLSGHLQRKCM